ncbi:MAG: Mur ligase [Actinobacteria bacterium]|nr:Mur ligase [Actinomycetota bacterium]
MLDGPNLYFTRPAIKLTLGVGGWSRATEHRALRLAGQAGLPGTGPRAGRGPGIRPGLPRTQQRLRFVTRLAAHLTRVLAGAAGTRLAVRARPGPSPDTIVVAYPWRHRGIAEALGKEVAGVLRAMLRSGSDPSRLVAGAAARVARTDPGPSPTVPRPRIPVVAVTGTNGKTTTVRLLAHIVRAAGRTVAYSSTDGVFVDGRPVEEGDYSGFGGAGRALTQPGVEVAVLETARGGILLRGIGTTHNDVAVVTNVSADHLGLHGIHTLDQLAEVKATITRITRPDGWDVLNADDPRVLAMRRGIRGRPWLFSTDPDHPALRTALEERGRAVTVIDGAISVLEPGGSPRLLVPLEDVPVTLAGISTHNIQNALAATAAALGIALPVEAVVEGLRTFVMDPERNPGRSNLFELEGRVVVIDYAHNEAGLAGLVETCRGLRPPRGEIWLGYSTAGDRSDEIVHGLGYVAARGADHVAIAELPRYLRGRDRRELIGLLRAGAVDGGKDPDDVPDFPDELRTLDALLSRSRPRDVVAVTALGQRSEIFAELERRGATRVSPSRARKLARAARHRAPASR